MLSVKAITRLVAALTLLIAQPLVARSDGGSAAIFALIDNNEWCPGGSVYLDLRSGSFLLYPRLARPACADPETQAPVEQGTLAEPALQRLRTAYFEARRAGLSRDNCDMVVSNGGPQVVVITGPAFSAITPDNAGCWSAEAAALHDELFDIFGGQRQPR